MESENRVTPMAQKSIFTCPFMMTMWAGGMHPV